MTTRKQDPRLDRAAIHAAFLRAVLCLDEEHGGWESVRRTPGDAAKEERQPDAPAPDGDPEP